MTGDPPAFPDNAAYMAQMGQAENSGAAIVTGIKVVF